MDREQFMKACGTYYASLGGTFGAYRSAVEGMAQCEDVQAIYSALGIKRETNI